MTDIIQELSDLRMSYEQGTLLETDVNANPHLQFIDWFNQALQADLHEPYAMSLATADAQGRPHVRTVLLRGATEQGYDFYTNYDSQKGLDMAENPYVELLFYWAKLERQARIFGRVSKIPEAESTAYYHKRPLGSQIAAHASTPQSGVIATREAFEQKVHDLEQQFAEAKQGEIDKPSFWGGYRVVAEHYEFWQGRPSRLHDRIRYRLQDGQWTIERLMP
ncbi:MULTISPECIES: pyridoxamine 5'-phosphate oxidase [unclassified Acinetobacter]|uniref:pyridoxamine 5'-phosphate oxidase n=1 Tax=unclassified Acinetobacter TaxID=196816 RepID=UPI0035B7A7BA